MKDEIHRTIEQQFDWIEETEQYIGIQKLKLSLELQECTIRTRTLKAISKYIELSKHGATDESLRAKGAAEGYLALCEELGFMSKQITKTLGKMLR